MTRKLATLAAMVLMLLPVLAAAQGSGAVAAPALSGGKEHLRRDEYAMAVKSFTRDIAKHPKKSALYDLRACAYLKLDSLDLAFKDAAMSQQLDTNEQTGYIANWLKGIVLLRQGDAANADSALSRAALGSPSVAGQRIARARQDTDSIFGEEGGTEQSNEQYRLKLADLLLDECIDYQLFGKP